MTFVLHIYICNYYSQSEMEIYMSENDFRKQLLLNEFKTLSKGKNKEEIVPLIFALSQKAKQAGIQFTYRPPLDVRRIRHPIPQLPYT